MKYQSDQHFIYLINPPFHRKDEIKSRLSATWFDTNKRGKGWRVPKNLYSFRELYKFFPELRNDGGFMKDYETASNDLKFWINKKESNITPDYGNMLRGYQMQDAWYLQSRGSCLVLNEPRTGRLVL